MMMMATNSRAREGKEEVKGKYGGIWWEEEGNVNYGEMVQSSQQYVAPYITGVEWGLGPIALRIVAAIWAGISSYTGDWRSSTP